MIEATHACAHAYTTRFIYTVRFNIELIGISGYDRHFNVNDSPYLQTADNFFSGKIQES